MKTFIPVPQNKKVPSPKKIRKLFCEAQDRIAQNTKACVMEFEPVLHVNQTTTTPTLSLSYFH